MRKTAIAVAAIIAIVSTALVGDEFGYRRWRRSFEAFVVEAAASRSGWDGQARATSFDPAAYSFSLSLAPTRFVTYSKKPVAALVFEPPWYVWSYHLRTHSPQSNRMYEAFMSTGLASHARIRPRDPCHVAFTPTGMQANCGFETVLRSGG